MGKEANMRIATISFLAFALASCGNGTTGNSPCDKIVGSWETSSVTAQVSRDGAVYSVSAQYYPDMNKTWTGACTDGVISLGDINASYLASGDHLSFMGKEFMRVMK